MRQAADSYEFFHTSYSYAHSIDEIPRELPPQQSPSAAETVPSGIFAHASTMQALARYLVDERRLTFTQAAALLGRSPKTVWTSYHQTAALPSGITGIPIPLSIFTAGPSPLESLVLYLRSTGLRNVDIARELRLDPKTTWTAAKRGEARR